MSSFLSSVYECYELSLCAKILRGAVLEEACDRKVSLKLNTSEVLFMSNHVLSYELNYSPPLLDFSSVSF